MRSGICPKCGSADVHSGEALRKKQMHKRMVNSIPITLFRVAHLENYVCVNCGYLERYITSEKDLDRIEAKWPKIHPSPSEDQL